ncbi:DUF1588 domain-containing protein [Akkermansiaceae bacterium]|nr:DUF1588 domain-containing protein [Akkermansiaceae bacterium]
MESHCVQCHGTEKKKGKVTLHDIGFDFSDADTADRWIDVLDQLTSEDMPPEEEEQPETAERNRIIEWIEGNLKDADQGEAYRQKLLAPEYGNWVSHEKLFSGEIDTPPYSPSRLWRYSPEIFDRRGFGKARSPFTYVTPEKGIRDYAATSTADRSTVQMVLINAEQFLEEREKKGDFKIFADEEPMPTDEILARTVEQEFRRIIGRMPIEAEQAKYLAFLKENIKLGGKLAGLKTMIKAIFLNPEAVYRMEFGLGGVDEHGRRHLSPEEMVYTLTYALTDELPERSKPIWDAYQNGKLNNKEDAANVVRQMLDEQLGEGPWSNRKVPRIMRFFEQFFGFDRAGDVFKDDERKRLEAIPQWNTALLMNDARMLIEHILRKDKDVIAELLTTNDYFVAHPGDNGYAREFYEQQIAEVLDPGYVEAQVTLKREQLDKAPPRLNDSEHRKKQLADAREKAESKVRKFKTALEAGINPHPEFPFSNRSHGIGDLIYITPYNLPESKRNEPQKWNWPIEQPFEMPSEQRAGLLTHPAWLAAWSVNDGNDPIHRGIWVYEKLLAGKLQDVPPDVDAKVPVDPHQTLRERMGLLREERCWNCHHKINPLGETFEMFDDWGRYRTEDFFGEDGKIVTRRDATFERLLEDGKLTARKVDATGTIAGTGEAGVDGDVENAVEMLHRLGKSQRVRQSFIRHLFRYFMGRNEMLSDSRTLVEAEKAYMDSDGSFKELVVSLLSSDSFLYRR